VPQFQENCAPAPNRSEYSRTDKGKLASRIYFDHNASSPILPEAREAMLQAMALTGNPSSIHGEGRALRALVEGSRRALAGKLDCDARQIVFTSGATEAAALALSPKMVLDGKEVVVSRLYASAVEHPCILAGGRFPRGDIVSLPVDENGVLSPETVEKALAGHDSDSGLAMVAIMAANNETGVVQPVHAIAQAVREAGAILLVDAVQGLQKLDITPARTGADLVLYSAHKIGGPQGAGALVRVNDALSPEPLARGGGQENFHRAGTENAAAIAGFAAAAEVHYPGEQIRELRDFIEARISTICSESGPDAGRAVFFGSQVERLGNTTCFAVPGISAETALISLDLTGIALSSGSACSSGRVGRSHVLAAMGVGDELARGALRLSLGPANSMDEAHRFARAFEDIVRQHARGKRVAAGV
jgi:cysteine desulfurase